MTTPPTDDAQPLASDAVSDAPSPAPRRSAARIVVLACLAAMALCVAIAIHFAPRPVAPPVIPAYTPQQAATAQVHMYALRDQFIHPPPAAAPAPASAPATRSDSAANAAANPTPPAASGAHPVRFEISEGDINTFLATNARIKTGLQQRGIEAVQVAFQPPDIMVLRATILYRDRKENVLITGELVPNPDTILRFDATRGQAGRFPIPIADVDAEAGKLTEQLAGLIHGHLPVTIQKVQVSGDRLVLIGTAQNPIT